jgi:hypothetical protein
MAERQHFRSRDVSCKLSEDEYTQLRSVCRELHIPVRAVLMLGVRSALRLLADERRKQREQCRNGNGNGHGYR